MRTSIAIAFSLLAGCRVADKQAPADGPPIDAAVDAQVLTGPLDTTIQQEPAMFSNTAQALFAFSSSDPAATFECVVDSAASQACASPWTATLPDGGHSFSVRAANADGMSDETPAEYLWTIDTIAPDTILTKTPPAADNSVMVVFKFRSNEDNTWFDCDLDNAGFVTCTSGEQFGPVGNGTHSFAVRAHDRAGNVDDSPAIYAWTVDTSTPDTEIITGPPAATKSTTAMFTFTSPDAGSGATYQCLLDASAFASCASPFTTSGLSEASHTFEVRVTDAVGNTDPTPATATWVVDLTPPQTTISSGPSGTVPIASASFTFTSNEMNVTYACSLDGAAFAACTSPFNAQGLGQGPHSFAVVATDTAGNTDPTPATASWTVDTIPPTVAITGGPTNGGTSGPRVTFTFAVSDGSVACSVDGGAFAACASPMAMNLAAGTHTFAVRATDAAGNQTIVTVAWTVACAAPNAMGAAGLLHLDDTGQVLANAVSGGIAATLGNTIAVEPSDPVEYSPGRFGGALAFAPANSEHATWPAALPAATALAIAVWAQPDSVAGARDVLDSGDARVSVKVVADSPTTVHFTFAIVETGPGGMTRSVASAAVAAGAWHYVVASLAEPSLYLWVDGVRTTFAGAHPNTALALDSLVVGGNMATAYSGSLDELWLAETAFTTDDGALAGYCPL